MEKANQKVFFLKEEKKKYFLEIHLEELEEVKKKRYEKFWYKFVYWENFQDSREKSKHRV